MEKSVIVSHVTKKYKMFKNNSEKILDLLLPGGRGQSFYALKDVSFEAENGDVVGIIGVNGSGKSTLSNIIAGVVPPTSGTVTVNGDAALIAIQSGLKNELTGRENIELKCLMLGFNRNEIERMMPHIIEFADIGDFIDQPVKSYSSGMRSRLGFAISVHINPDILIIDEALSVGDQTFADKCYDKMNEFKEKGKTIFFISHSLGQVKKFCKKALWIQYGEVKDYGPIDKVMPEYQKFISRYKKMSEEEKNAFKETIRRRRMTV
ncbi:MAG: teichoic acids export ABC transporter ATP-binding subunit TagH [Sporolactobacillus sp.]|jgi:teichoic acid transport system ATP-binding protein|nr:teichoic acids export ABC transporter ATP-binding subunit TagH [Sporolactobacillus sp.]MCI1882055.1 teichoic acids export ABC transporter ATP-binding subunit TagH [Sporolactobacillus sp.]